jgi:hypothetical protein
MQDNVIQLKKVKIDEIEMYLNLSIAQFPEVIKNLNYKEIAKYIENNYNVECSEDKVFLLYEPTIEQDIFDMESYYREVLGL